MPPRGSWMYNQWEYLIKCVTESKFNLEIVNFVVNLNKIKLQSHLECWHIRIFVLFRDTISESLVYIRQFRQEWSSIMYANTKKKTQLQVRAFHNLQSHLAYQYTVEPGYCKYSVVWHFAIIGIYLDYCKYEEMLFMMHTYFMIPAISLIEFCNYIVLQYARSYCTKMCLLIRYAFYESLVKICATKRICQSFLWYVFQT